jgi:tRNA pseudouridine32 synthase/23S rRNA pseudouridine746 synthase
MYTMNNENTPHIPCFIAFKQSIEEITQPERFTFPFYYEPHALSLAAAEELQYYLEHQTELDHYFGHEKDQAGIPIGKMFGVLVVETKSGDTGYLAAFSGKVGGKNLHPNFVPPIFDLLDEEGFYRKEEETLNVINREIEKLEQEPEYQEIQTVFLSETELSETELGEWKQKSKAAKKLRKGKRIAAEKTMEPLELESYLEEMRKQSIKEQYFIKDCARNWRLKLTEIHDKVKSFQVVIDNLKGKRKRKSALLQQRIFDHYNFLNVKQESKNVCTVFEHTSEVNPPSGSGDCAAPKLLQYAFQQELKPIAMAEFWWGMSPGTEVRKHKQFYPACRRKCEPILGHMLKGLLVDPNPLLVNPAEGKVLETVYEDEFLLVINKPAEFLSVPGKVIHDSVYQRMKDRFPEATGPLVVHRLDMSTSGLMLIAKTKDVHKNLQKQFQDRTITKRYVAMVETRIEEEKGFIDLPLRVDLDDRPRQLVCLEHGKRAYTEWEVIERTLNRTKIHFFPITGRTHQLRVHAAHAEGLNAPIVGDDLYGTKADRLYLHAEYIEFKHPENQEQVCVQVDAAF